MSSPMRNHWWHWIQLPTSKLFDTCLDQIQWLHCFSVKCSPQCIEQGSSLAVLVSSQASFGPRELCVGCNIGQHPKTGNKKSFADPNQDLQSSLITVSVGTSPDKFKTSYIHETLFNFLIWYNKCIEILMWVNTSSHTKWFAKIDKVHNKKLSPRLPGHGAFFCIDIQLIFSF